MWYSAGGLVYPISIGAAISPDGVVWTRVGNKPVVTDPEFINNYGDPHVILDGGLFKMWIGILFGEGAIYYTDSLPSTWSAPKINNKNGTSHLTLWSWTRMNAENADLVFRARPCPNL